MYSGTMPVEKIDDRVWVMFGDSGTWFEYKGLTIEQAVISFAKQFGIRSGRIKARWRYVHGEHGGEFNVSSREVWEVSGLRGGES